MEQDIAILMADLTGYTALTETHGASAAADLIDKYLEIVEGCIVGNCHLHERVGDEVMIISTSADNLLATATVLIQNAHNEENFLQLHGGLHYGRVLKRKSGYFGSTINLTSRIAAKASPGAFWCSREFIDALSDKSSFTFEEKGKHNFKNVNEECLMFELVLSNTKSFYVDPVCRMMINEQEKAIPHPREHNIFFCSQHCLDIYIKNSERVI